MLRRFFRNETQVASASVLVIDNDPQVLNTIASILGAEGYIPRIALSTTIALQLLDEMGLPSLMILDLAMPQGGEKDFLTLARIRYGRAALPPTLLLTASREGEAIAKGLNLNDYLPKPFDTQVLLQHIAFLLKNAAS